MNVEIRCPFCGFQKGVESSTIPGGARYVRCPRCEGRFAIPGKEGSEGDLSESLAAVEKASGDFAAPGLLVSLGQVVRQVFLSPRSFFREKANSFDRSTAFGMGLLMGGAGAMAGFFWGVVLDYGPAPATVQGDGAVWSLGALTQGLISAPLQVAIRIGVTSAVANICLFLAGSARNGLWATFRAACFGQFPCVAAAVPFVGMPLAFVWSAALHFIAIKEIHGISYGRVTIALLFFIFFAVIILLFAAVGQIFDLLDIRGAFTGDWP